MFITYAKHVEQTLIHVTRISLAVQYETSQFIVSTCTTMHGWCNYVIHGAQFVALSGDHNEVFESLYIVLQSLLLTSTVNFRISNRIKIFFFFNIWLLRFDYCAYKSFFTLEKVDVHRTGSLTSWHSPWIFKFMWMHQHLLAFYSCAFLFIISDKNVK